VRARHEEPGQAAVRRRVDQVIAPEPPVDVTVHDHAALGDALHRLTHDSPALPRRSLADAQDQGYRVDPVDRDTTRR
jgi:hypothetical protein